MYLKIYTTEEHCKANKDIYILKNTYQERKSSCELELEHG